MRNFFKIEKLIFLMILGLAFFLGGYYSKKKIETSKVEVKKEQVVVEKEVVRYVVRQINKPDGTVIREEIAETETQQENRVSVEKKEEKKVVISDKKKWQLNYLGMYRANNEFLHGVQLSRRIGDSPFMFGVWAIQNTGIGISLGMEF